jgi:hypothetical protein
MSDDSALNHSKLHVAMEVKNIKKYELYPYMAVVYMPSWCIQIIVAGILTTKNLKYMQIMYHIQQAMSSSWNESPTHYTHSKECSIPIS